MKRILFSAVACAILAPVAAVAQGYYHMGGGHGWGGWGHGIFGPLMMIVFIAIVVVVIVLIVRWLGGGSRWQGKGDDRALDILRERFARGEIDKDEFDERRKLLGG